MAFRAFSFLGCILLFLHCGEELAGGSTGVDNPESIISMVDSSGAPVTVSGTIMLYKRDQNPVADPLPVYQDSVKDTSSFVLDTARIAGRLNTAPGDILPLNMIIQTTSGLASINSSLSYSDGRLFYDNDPDLAAKNNDLTLSPPGTMAFAGARDMIASCLDSTSQADSAAACEALFSPVVYYARAYIPGTPFIAEASDGLVFSGLPPGRYPVVFLDSAGTEVFRDSISVD